MPAYVIFSPRDVGDEPGGREDEREGEVDDGGPRGGDGDATDGGVGFLIIPVIDSFLILTSNSSTMFAEMGGLRNTEVAFLLPTVQPWVRIPARLGFFLFTAYSLNRIEIAPA